MCAGQSEKFFFMIKFDNRMRHENIHSNTHLLSRQTKMFRTIIERELNLIVRYSGNLNHIK